MLWSIHELLVICKLLSNFGNHIAFDVLLCLGIARFSYDFLYISASKARHETRYIWPDGSLSLGKLSDFADFQASPATADSEGRQSHTKNKRFCGNHSDVGMCSKSARNQVILMQNG